MTHWNEGEFYYWLQLVREFYAPRFRVLYERDQYVLQRTKDAEEVVLPDDIGRPIYVHSRGNWISPRQIFTYVCQGVEHVRHHRRPASEHGTPEHWAD